MQCEATARNASRRSAGSAAGGGVTTMAIRLTRAGRPPWWTSRSGRVVPTPTELFFAGPASCVAFYARRYASRHQSPADGLQVAVTYELGTVCSLIPTVNRSPPTWRTLTSSVIAFVPFRSASVDAALPNAMDRADHRYPARYRRRNGRTSGRSPERALALDEHQPGGRGDGINYGSPGSCGGSIGSVGGGMSRTLGGSEP